MPACAESEVIMNENRPKGNQKHIDLSGRIRIEQGLNNGESFRTIARVIIPGLFEPPVRTLRATIPENESHIFR